MPKIQVLEKQIAELIAAGEVVERPSSVIKELVENAIDSGASVITVEIRNGGISFMRVTDNGCGISPQEVPLAFLRHATSKVVKQDDLSAIGTLGFRGEALASISAVARVEMLTRTQGSQTGMRYVGGGSEEYVLEEAGCPMGTTILVRDLFFNTPARMKFLKKDATEGSAVAGVVEKMALSHPEISFRFLRDGKELLHTPGDNKLSSAVYSVYGKEFSSTLIPVEYEMDHVKVSGFISTPAGCRPNRSMQNFFINGRFVKSRTAMAALEEAYKGSLMVGKFPACVLHIGLSFAAVDVNVHPAKLEVRFVRERPIFDAVYHGVKSALAVGDKVKVMQFKKQGPVIAMPEEPLEQVALPFLKPAEKHPASGKAAETADSPFSLPVLQDSEESLSPIKQEPAGFSEYLSRVLDHGPAPEPEPSPFSSSNIVKEQGDLPVPPSPPLPEQKKPAIKSFNLQREYKEKLLGEAFGTYLILEYTADSLMLIDKHAAHERLLYEKLKAQKHGEEAQVLLEPVPVVLEKNEYSALLEHQETLLQMGFEVDDFGLGTVLVRSVPMILDGADAASAVMEIAGYLASFKNDLTTERLDWVYHNVACRAAMKAGDLTSREELIRLAEELEQNPQVRYCPHGRPVFILIRKKDIERQFGRM